MKILTKQIDEFKSSLTGKVLNEYIVYLIDENGERVKAQTCIGRTAKTSIVATYITDIVINDKTNGTNTPIEFEDVSFEEFKNSLN